METFRVSIFSRTYLCLMALTSLGMKSKCSGMHKRAASAAHVAYTWAIHKAPWAKLLWEEGSYEMVLLTACDQEQLLVLFLLLNDVA